MLQGRIQLVSQGYKISNAGHHISDRDLKVMNSVVKRLLPAGFSPLQRRTKLRDRDAFENELQNLSDGLRPTISWRVAIREGVELDAIPATATLPILALWYPLFVYCAEVPSCLRCHILLRPNQYQRPAGVLTPDRNEHELHTRL